MLFLYCYNGVSKIDAGKMSKTVYKMQKIIGPSKLKTNNLMVYTY
jgi:hypothetical protein